MSHLPAEEKFEEFIAAEIVEEREASVDIGETIVEEYTIA